MAEEKRKMIYCGGEGEIVEKKSRFIAHIIPVTTEEQAIAFIADMKKKYWDARHNCYAYIVGTKDEWMRCSDDGEPSQTAGRPMLDVLIKEDIHNVVVVVTRYFGGVLLGTGGLVRAYQAAVKEGLSQCVIAVCSKGQKLDIVTDYNGLGKVEYLIRQRDIPHIDTAYQENVVISVVIPMEEKESIIEEITQQTRNTARLQWGEKVEFAVLRQGGNKKIEFF